MFSATNWLPKDGRSRLLYSAYDLTCTVLLTLYSAKLISLLAVKIFPIPFSTVEDIVDSEYSIGTYGGGIGATLMLNGVSHWHWDI